MRARATADGRRGNAEMLWVSAQANSKFEVKIVEARGVVGNLTRLFGIGVKAGACTHWCCFGLRYKSLNSDTDLLCACCCIIVLFLLTPAIYHGEELICRPEVTRYIAPVENPQWCGFTGREMTSGAIGWSSIWT